MICNHNQLTLIIQAYTSSILSFLFTNIGKPILITGAQIPLSQSRSDGWDNILDSLVVAGVLDFAGVGVVFNHSVLQGNRFVFSLLLALPPLLFYLAFPPHSPP
jgi:hypothetical protein